MITRNELYVFSPVVLSDQFHNLFFPTPGMTCRLDSLTSGHYLKIGRLAQ